MNNDSLIGRLLERRVPQITGLYIAATWMMIEIGDWVSERFMLPAELTSYIFVGMLVFLPSVILLAYQYGKKGKESWQKSTFYVTPINAVVAIVCMVVFVKPVQTTDIKVVLDETGEKKVFEVARAEHRKTVMVSFLNGRNLTDKFDWYRYALSGMLSEELKRDIYLNSFTPFRSMSIFDKLKERGLEQGNVMPTGLLIQLAQESFVDYLVHGDVAIDDANIEAPNITLSIQVYSLKTNRVVGRFSQQSTSIYDAVEEVSSAIHKVMEIPKSKDSLDAHLPLTEYYTSSLEALRLFTEAHKLYYFHRSIQGAIELLQQSLEKDSGFVNARASLGNLLRVQGAPKDAMQQYALALQHDYKISQRAQFSYRSTLLSLKGDYDSLLKLLDMWVEIYPDDTNAHQMMARTQMSAGKDLVKAERSLLKLRELMPDNDNNLVSLASLNFLNKNFKATLEYMNHYIERNPMDKNGYRYIATFYMQMGEHQKARESYDKILLLEPSNFEAQLNKIYLSVVTGETNFAKNELNTLIAATEKNQEKLAANQVYQWILTNSGQYQSFIERYQLPELDYSDLSPLSRMMSVEIPIAQAKIQLGRYDEAIAELESIKGKLQHPYDRTVSSSLMLAYFYQEDANKLEHSIKSLAKFLDSNPNPWLRQQLEKGQTYWYELTGDFAKALAGATEAKEKMSKAMSTASNSFSYLEQKTIEAKYLMKTGRVDDAISSLNEVLRVYPSYALAKLYLLQAYLENNNQQSAKELIKELDQVWEQADESYYYFKVYQQLKQRLI